MKSRWGRSAVLAGVCAGVITVLALISHSASSVLADEVNPANADYNLLVRGFQSGQLNLKKEPPPGFAQLATPYDPVANVAYRTFPHFLHDLSYYRGKFYLYFGVTPALMLFWPWAALTGHFLSHGQGALVFCAAGFLAGAAILLAVWRRNFPGIGTGVAAACILAVGLAGGAPVLLRRPGIYEVPISCAHALVMLALGAILLALRQTPRRGWWLAAASLLYGLAVGARPSLLFGAVILGAPVAQAWAAASDTPPRYRVWWLAGAAALPLALVGAGLMAYNALRFGNPLEFGQHYQLAGVVINQFPTFSPEYLWFNLRVYFLEPVRLSRDFPFVRDIVQPPLPPGHALMESPFGILANVPLAWLALAAPLCCRGLEESARSALRWFLAATACFFGIAALTLSFYQGSCSRYEVDFLPALILLAVLGIFGLEAALASHPRRRLAARWGWGLLLALSVAFNLLASLQQNPELRYEHAKIMLAQGRLPEAIADYDAVLRLKPDYVEAGMGMAEALNRAGRRAEAITRYERVLRLDPRNAVAENNLGLDLVETGRSAEGMAHLEEAVRIDPDSYTAHYNLGLNLAAAGRIPEAIAEFQSALRLKPDSISARTHLERLQSVSRP